MEISYYERISYEDYCRLYQKQVEFRPTALKCLEDIGFRYFWKHRGGSSPDKDFTSMFKNGKPECVGLISFVRGCHVWELDDEYYLINLLRIHNSICPEYYLADQLDGLRKFFEDKNLISDI
jgi:hypothetical protein